MEQVVLYPPSTLPDINGLADNDIPVPETINLYKVYNGLVTSYGYVIEKFQLLTPAISIRHRASISIKNIFVFTFFKKKIIVKTPCLSITNGWCDSYYHFTLECLPKLFLLKESIPTSTVVVPNDIKDFHKQWFKLLQVNNIQLVSNNEVVKTPLIITTNFIARDLNHHNLITPAFSKWVISFIINITSLSYPKIFIGRKYPKHRILINNEAVKLFLSEYGFVYLEMEDFSVEQQVKLFNNAEQIIAVHGAALTNSCFCKPNTKIIDLMHQDFNQLCFLKLALTMNLSYHILRCNGSNNKPDLLPGYRDIEVNIEELSTLLKLW